MVIVTPILCCASRSLPAAKGPGSWPLVSSHALSRGRKGHTAQQPHPQARVPGALQWWRLQEARGPSPGRTGLPQDLPLSQQLWRLCLPSAGPPPGLQPHLRVLTQPGSNTGPCLFLSASSTAVDEDLGGHPLPNFWDSFQVALEAILRGWSGRMGTAQEEGWWPGRLGPAGQASFHPEPGLGSRAAAVCLPLALTWVVVSRAGTFFNQ